MLTHDASFHSAFDADVFICKCNVINKMKLQFAVNSVRQLVVVMVLVFIAGCGSGAKDKSDLKPGSAIDQGPAVGTAEIVGKNCRAEVIADANGTKHYKSTYFNIYSDGSEQVQNVVETETPCP